MKLLLYCTLTIFCITFLYHIRQLKAQCTCDAPSNISINWSKPIDVGIDDVCWDIIPIDDDQDAVADDGYIVVGSVNSDAGGANSGMDIYIARLNTAGTTIVWDEAWDGGMSPANQDVAYSIIQTSTGHILIRGSAATNHFGSSVNRNAWVGKMDVDGNWVNGWPKQYGSTGDDIAYDIAEDLSGNYVIAGTASASGNDLGSQTVHSDGDYWVFKIGATGYLNTNYSKVYYGSNSGNDYARSILVDCSTGQYIVSGFCKSCDPQNTLHSQANILKIPTNFGTPDYNETYGYNGSNQDFGSYGLIQPHSTFGTCAVTPDPLDGFLTIGIQHPADGCFGGQHDFWLVKTDNVLADVDFSEACVDADAGGAYGGKLKDNGHSVVQACEGYLLAGITKSNNLDLTCSNCQVQCNHYDCDEDETEDIWLVMVNSETGEYIWDESLGASGDDGAYSIKRVHDGSYVVAGYLTNANGDTDFYIVNFEIVTTCVAPVLDDPDISTYCSTLSWTTDPCVPYYDLRYREGTGAWVLVANASSPYVITNPTNDGVNSFSWGVRARCSPNYWSSYTGGDGFNISYCGSSPVNCTSCTKLASQDLLYDNKNVLNVYPNPSSGSFNLSCQFSLKVNREATVEIVDQLERCVSTYTVEVSDGLIDQQFEGINVPPGFYLVRLSVDGEIYKARIVFQ